MISYTIGMLHMRVLKNKELSWQNELIQMQGQQIMDYEKFAQFKEMGAFSVIPENISIDLVYSMYTKNWKGMIHNGPNENYYKKDYLCDNLFSLLYLMSRDLK